jgi:hypothetical protein
MSIKTLEVEKIQEVTGNVYEAIVIVSKRARQIAAREKMELDEKLKYFEGFEEEEEFAFNEEQERISKEYEKRDHPTQRGVAELLKGETTFRKPE